MDSRLDAERLTRRHELARQQNKPVAKLSALGGTISSRLLTQSSEPKLESSPGAHIALSCAIDRYKLPPNVLFSFGNGRQPIEIIREHL